MTRRSGNDGSFTTGQDIVQQCLKRADDQRVSGWRESTGYSPIRLAKPTSVSIPLTLSAFRPSTQAFATHQLIGWPQSRTDVRILLRFCTNSCRFRSISQEAYRDFLQPRTEPLANKPYFSGSFGDPGRIRTCNLPLRRGLLYPVEPRSRALIHYCVSDGLSPGRHRQNARRLLNSRLIWR